MSKPKVLVTLADFPQSGIDLLKSKCDVEINLLPKHILSTEELHKMVQGKSGIFCCTRDKIDKEFLDAAGDTLKVVGTFSVGVDHVDLNEMKRREVKLGYTPDVLTEAVAELNVALLLATSRRLFEANKRLRSGEVSFSPVWMCGPALKGSVVGIVGYGRIGQSVAEKLKVFKVSKILYTSRTQKPCPLGGVQTELETLLAQSDFVIATCAFTPETKLLFNKERFALMKPTAIFINTTRGGVVDQDALLEVLQNGRLRAAGLDVTTPEPFPSDHPLLHLDNCVILPHIGSATYQTRMAMSDLTAENIISALEGKPMPAEYPL